MSRSPISRTESAIRWAATLVAALALAHLAVLATLFAARLGYRFDIEWMEGGSLVEAWRLRQGLPLYAAPSAAFVPFPYPPLHPWLIAAASWLLFAPVGYPLGRALSIAAFAAVCAAIWLAVRREGGWRRDALAATGVAAAGFAFTGGWFDLIRVDTLCLAFATAGFAVLRARGERWPGVAAGAALLTLALYTKQTAILFVAAGALAVALVRTRLVPLYLAVAGALAAAGAAWLEWRSAGWFRRYVLEVLGAHSRRGDVLVGGAWEHMLGGLWPIAALVALAWLAAWRAREGRRGLAFWSVFAAAGVLASALGASIQWSVDNVYLPALFGAAALAGVGAAALRRRGSGWPLAGAALLAAQLVLIAYDPRGFLPGAERARARRFIDSLRAVEGELLVPHHPFAAVEAGKEPALHLMALGAARRAGLATPADLERGIRDQRWAAIVLDRAPGRELDVWPSYKVGAFLGEDERPRTLAGFAIAPRYLLVPKRAEPPESGVAALVDFESGSWGGWQLSGDAFGPAPAGGPTRFQGPVGPFGGRFLANSGHPTARATGRALSPEFEIPSSALRVRVGGDDRAGLAVRLLVDGAAVFTARGSGSNELRPVPIDASAWRGRRARLELVDQDPDGCLLVDDLVALAD